MEWEKSKERKKLFILDLLERHFILWGSGEIKTLTNLIVNVCFCQFLGFDENESFLFKNKN